MRALLRIGPVWELAISAPDCVSRRAFLGRLRYKVRMNSRMFVPLQNFLADEERASTIVIGSAAVLVAICFVASLLAIALMT